MPTSLPTRISLVLVRPGSVAAPCHHVTSFEAYRAVVLARSGL